MCGRGYYYLFVFRHKSVVKQLNEIPSMYLLCIYNAEGMKRTREDGIKENMLIDSNLEVWNCMYNSFVRKQHLRKY